MASRRAAVPRPKRAGEEFARTHDFSSDSGAASKKPRFDVRNPSALAPDALEDDAFLEADEIGKRGLGTKRNAVQVDGYGSDSSNEGFDARAEAKAKRAKGGSKDEEQDDMFADLEQGDGDEDEEVRAQGKKKGKNVRFLGEDEIEGQVAGSRSGGHVSADFSVAAGAGKGSGNGIADRVRGSGNVEDSEESDVDEEERADVGDVDEEIGAGGKKEHAPKLDAFNMKSEQEEGRFDDQGNYVRKAADADAVHDTWLEGVSKKDMKKAKEAAEKRDDEQRQKQREDDALLTSDILNTLIRHLDKGETVLEALARLGKVKAKKVQKWKKSNKNKKEAEDTMDVDVEKPPEDPAETRRKAAVEAITGAADQLYTRGQAEIYDAEREGLIRQYGRETGEQWVDPPKEDKIGADGVRSVKQWEYRWSDARDGGEAHGPYDGPTMVQWNEAGYFGDGVEFREIGDSGWSRVVDFV